VGSAIRWDGQVSVTLTLAEPAARYPVLYPWCSRRELSATRQPEARLRSSSACEPRGHFIRPGVEVLNSLEAQRGAIPIGLRSGWAASARQIQSPGAGESVTGSANVSGDVWQ
jgi:hypothetical protein